MNTKHIQNRKAAFAIAMENHGSSYLPTTIAPAEMMALVANSDPLNFWNGVNDLTEYANADENDMMEYMLNNQCSDESLSEIRHSFLMDPIRNKLNKIKYEQGLIPDDEILAFALFLVGDSLLVREADTDSYICFDDSATLVNHVANRLKFLCLCMSDGRYDLLNTVIQYARKEMCTTVATNFVFDEVEADDGGVAEYYRTMTDPEAFKKRYEANEEAFRKAMKTRAKDKNIFIDDQNDDIPTRADQDEPLVERDFEG